MPSMPSAADMSSMCLLSSSYLKYNSKKNIHLSFNMDSLNPWSLNIDGQKAALEQKNVCAATA